jgi:hypothetical protein
MGLPDGSPMGACCAAAKPPYNMRSNFRIMVKWGGGSRRLLMARGDLAVASDLTTPRKYFGTQHSIREKESKL